MLKFMKRFVFWCLEKVITLYGCFLTSCKVQGSEWRYYGYLAFRLKTRYNNSLFRAEYYEKHNAKRISMQQVQQDHQPKLSLKVGDLLVSLQTLTTAETMHPRILNSLRWMSSSFFSKLKGRRGRHCIEWDTPNSNDVFFRTLDIQKCHMVVFPQGGRSPTLNTCFGRWSCWTCCMPIHLVLCLS